MLAEQHVEDDAVDAVVRAVDGDRPHLAVPLAEPVHAALALFVAGRVPGEVVVHDGLEVLLEVHALGQAVGRDQDGALRLVPGQTVDARHTLVRRQRPGDGGDRVAVAQAPGQVLGDVFGGVDEAAEDHRVVPVEQQLLRGLLDQLELLVAGAFELPGAGGETPQPPPVRRVPV